MRFAREARAAAAVVHENVVAIHAVSEANGLPYLVMPYVRGTSLQKRLDAQGPLAAPEILRIGMQVAAGITAAHAQGLVHRDIKPANILLEDGVERLTITDFGLARAADDASLTRSGVIAGTPQFMSPEQARGENIDARSDLFSLGSVLYTLATGHAPFRAETTYGVLRRISDDLPRPIRETNHEIPEWLSAIVERLHAKSPADRFQSAGEVAQLFEQCLAHVQQPTSVPLPDNLRSRPAAPTADPRRTVRWLAAVFVIVALVATVAWALRERSKPDMPGGEPLAAAGQAASDREIPAAEPRSESARWDDGTAEQISVLEAEIEGLEMELNK
jgi:serine/threonine-protein kinase